MYLYVFQNPACVKASNAQGLSRKEADMEGEAEVKKGKGRGKNG